MLSVDLSSGRPVAEKTAAQHGADRMKSVDSSEVNAHSHWNYLFKREIG